MNHIYTHYIDIDKQRLPICWRIGLSDNNVDGKWAANSRLKGIWFISMSSMSVSNELAKIPNIDKYLVWSTVFKYTFIEANCDKLILSQLFRLLPVDSAQLNSAGACMCVSVCACILAIFVCSVSFHLFSIEYDSFESIEFYLFRVFDDDNTHSDRTERDDSNYCKIGQA